MGKEYVPVILYVNNGKITPLQFKSGGYNEWIKIIKVTDSRQRASITVGAVGIRYSCIIDYNETQREIYLFDEGNNIWFIENGDENFELYDNRTNEKTKKIYEDCPYCFSELLIEPIFEKHQGRHSMLCPYCRSHRSEWAKTIEEAINSWNNYMRNEM